MRGWIIALALTLVPCAAAAQPDPGWDARRDAAMAEIAGRYTASATYDNCVRWGFDTLYLAAAIEADARGLDNGIALADAIDDIDNLTDHALSLIGEGTTVGPCAWESAGSPAALHGALGLGWILHRHQDALPSALVAKLTRALDANWRASIERYLVNGNLSVVAGLLLGGEALGYDSGPWTRGLDALERIFAHVRDSGGLELNSPIYTHYHFAPLAALTTLRDERAATMARTLLEYELLVQAHLHLPGGGLGAPQSRDYAGGAADGSDSGMYRMIELMTGEGFEANGNPHLTGPVLADYRLPAAIRSIFLDKAEGYTFWVRTDAPVAPSRMPNAYYPIGGEDAPVAPWHAVVLPDAMLGINYGFRYQAIHVSMGAYARAPDGTFPILYHAQPYVAGDTTETGNGLPSGSGDTDADDFTRELMDFERMMVGRTMLSLWDPRPRDGVTRQAPDTRAHIPDWAGHGGEVREGGGWIVGSVGDAYVAYRPLGTPAVDEMRTDFRYLRIDGISGCIVELATPAEVGTLDDYLADLMSRALTFETDPLAASFEARDPETGALVDMRLEYRPEVRSIDGAVISDREALDHGMMESPWVRWDEPSGVLRLERDCERRVVYDWDAVTITDVAAPADCGAPGTTVFSPVPTWGDAVNWSPRDPSRWAVVEEDGDLRYWLAPFDFVPDGDRLGAYALAGAGSLDEVTVRMRVESGVDVGAVSNADFAVVFGWQSADDYAFFLASSTAEYNELFALEGGVRTSLGVADRAVLADGEWHDFELAIADGEVVVRSDGTEVLRVAGDFAPGDVGIGSLNDSVFFDDVEILTPSAPGVDASAGGADGGAVDGGGTEPPDGGGCGCRVKSSRSGAPIAWLLLAGLLILRRGRRRNRAASDAATRCRT